MVDDHHRLEVEVGVIHSVFLKQLVINPFRDDDDLEDLMGLFIFFPFAVPIFFVQADDRAVVVGVVNFMDCTCSTLIS